MSVHKVIAFDFDGTLADGTGVAPTVIGALQTARARGLRLVLVTGRILDELLEVFPEARSLFDAIVAENGAVLDRQGTTRDLAPPVAEALLDALHARGVHARQGRVLLACHAADDRAVLDEVRTLGLEDQLIHNRGELMVLPPGVTKASGVQSALAALGLNPHNLVAVGDAENDHALLSTSELAVAVQNAVPSLKAQADIVLGAPNGTGIIELLEGPWLRDDAPAPNERHLVALGTDEAGADIRIDPRRRILITGGTHSGKSYLAGLVAEHLVDAGYVVLVFDAEGDHARLDRLPDVVTISGNRIVTDPAAPAGLLDHPRVSVVIDLTPLSTPAQQELVSRVLPHVDAHRRRTGMPHHVILDEAHLFLDEAEHRANLLTSTDGGCCLVTYVPAALPDEVLREIDEAIVLPFGACDDDDPNIAAVASIGGLEPRRLAAALRGQAGTALLVQRRDPGEVATCTTGIRAVPHVRHRHKYVERLVDAHLAFRFCAHDDDRSGGVARSIDELNRELRRCSTDALRHHAARNDFSRWALDVLRDPELSVALADAEAALQHRPEVPEEGRARLLDAIETRYLR